MASAMPVFFAARPAPRGQVRRTRDLRVSPTPTRTRPDQPFRRWQGHVARQPGCSREAPGNAARNQVAIPGAPRPAGGRGPGSRPRTPCRENLLHGNKTPPAPNAPQVRLFPFVVKLLRGHKGCAAKKRLGFARSPLQYPLLHRTSRRTDDHPHSPAPWERRRPDPGDPSPGLAGPGRAAQGPRHRGRTRARQPGATCQAGGRTDHGGKAHGPHGVRPREFPASALLSPSSRAGGGNPRAWLRPCPFFCLPPGAGRLPAMRGTPLTWACFLASLPLH